jgi:hypothetical protein
MKDNKTLAETAGMCGVRFLKAMDTDTRFGYIAYGIEVPCPEKGKEESNG